MFDPELVRTLCLKLLEETDPARFDELADRLHAMVSSNTDQMRLKVDFLARHYPELLVVDEPLPPKITSKPTPKPKAKRKNSRTFYFIR